MNLQWNSITQIQYNKIHDKYVPRASNSNVYEYLDKLFFDHDQQVVVENEQRELRCRL